MARATRIDYPGAWHHVMNRGARREAIFRSVEDCQVFLDGVAEVVERYGIEVHAYALMPNHYHLLVHSPHATLSAAMQRLGARYTSQLNARHGWDGPVFRGRFRNRLVTRDEHLIWLLAYIHLNPLRAHLAQALEEDAWTSHRAYLGLDRPPPWLRRDVLLGRFANAEALGRFVDDIHRRRHDFPEDLEVGRWSAQVEVSVDVAQSGVRSGEEALTTDVESVLEAVCRITGVDRAALTVKERGRGANPARRFAAWALARSTPLNNVEIARALEMAPAQIQNLLSRMRRGTPEPLASWRKVWFEDGEPKRK